MGKIIVILQKINTGCPAYIGTVDIVEEFVFHGYALQNKVLWVFLLHFCLLQKEAEASDLSL